MLSQKERRILLSTNYAYPIHLFNIILSSPAAGNVGEIIKKGAGVSVCCVYDDEVPVNGTLREECGITCFFIPLL